MNLIRRRTGNVDFLEVIKAWCGENAAKEAV
jgi:hypothetical protein